MIHLVRILTGSSLTEWFSIKDYDKWTFYKHHLWIHKLFLSLTTSSFVFTAVTLICSPHTGVAHVTSSALCCLQSPSTWFERCVRGSSQRSSSGIQTAASTQTVASASTTVNICSRWTWSRVQARRLAPGLLVLSTLWQASAMRTVWPNGSAPGTNILQYNELGPGNCLVFCLMQMWIRKCLFSSIKT